MYMGKVGVWGDARYVHVYVHTDVRAYMYAYMYIYIHTYACTYMYIFEYVCSYKYIYAYRRVHVYISAFAFLYMYVHMSRCIFVPISVVCIHASSPRVCTPMIHMTYVCKCADAAKYLHHQHLYAAGTVVRG